jgi:uncharacterized membrane protein
VRRFQHPVNQSMIEDAALGVRVADAVTAFLGSWRFIIIQTAIVAVWITGNVYLLFNFDPFPFILLNLAFSTQAAYAAPLILLAGNRTAQRDRLTLEHTAEEADKEDDQNLAILEGIKRLEEANHALLERVVALETSIIDNQTKVEAALGGLSASAGNAGHPGPQ